MQDEHQRSETKLTQTTNDLNEASNKTDEINRAIKTLETKNMIDEESKSKIKFILTHEACTELADSMVTQGEPWIWDG